MLKLAPELRQVPPPIPLSLAEVRAQSAVMVVGFPAFDSKEQGTPIQHIFGGVYDVKRASPGRITEVRGALLLHDASTLGGNSGSVMLDLDTGAAVGLHFAGTSRVANFGVKLSALRDALQEGPYKKLLEAAVEERRGSSREGRSAASYRGDGYSQEFLGDGVQVPLPRLAAGATPAPLLDGTGNVLRYTHFSIVVNRNRRLPYYTAVNIDGHSLLRIARSRDVWNYDPRIERDHQVGNELYANNDLDRGHMVRRLDPVWGGDAAMANDDTFHFTNSCPQHKDLNQKTWNDLEDYVLDNAEAHDLRVCVFTGPIFQRNDPEYRGISIPRRFWKVVVIRRGAEKRLSATAYVLDQSHLLADIELPEAEAPSALRTTFTYGQFRTYQVPIEDIAADTGLEFDQAILAADPLSSRESLLRRVPLPSAESIHLG